MYFLYLPLRFYKYFFFTIVVGDTQVLIGMDIELVAKKVPMPVMPPYSGSGGPAAEDALNQVTLWEDTIASKIMVEWLKRMSPQMSEKESDGIVQQFYNAKSLIELNALEQALQRNYTRVSQ
jgi:hypothetical protein